MKIAIIGSRTGFTEEFVHEKLYELVTEKYPGIRLSFISGGARGIDTYAKNWITNHNMISYSLEIIRPIDPSNKLDYLFRNVEIITKADKIIAFWDGQSKGTKFVIDYAKARGKDIEVITNGNNKG